uniref:Laccase n=1 Tax=Pleurotus salmoneostramineus TaxID=64638 RepID=D2KZ00_9AGAR|nr:laccase [Pleurotus salmoneostramineus]
MTLLTLSLVVSAAALTAHAAIGPVADLPIVNMDLAPDGTTRPTVLAAGTFPGPLIRGNKGDNFRIDVINQLSDTQMDIDTSIHWHGLFQKGTNWADGPAMVTQCPIIPDHSFLYDFNVPDQAGTFWYHSHLGLQYCDGLRGAFVVYDPNDPHKNLYDVDDESTVLTIGDWYHVPSPQEGGPPSADSTLFNGKGRFRDDPTADLFVMNVDKGSRYRIRLVSIACDPWFDFAIDGHNFTIIEADGESTQPHTVDALRIFAGQRYSIVLTADQDVGNYWIRGNPNPASSIAGFDGGINSAILRYNTAPVEEPTTQLATPQIPLREQDLVALTNPTVPGTHTLGAADINIPLNFAFDAANALFAVNNFTFVPPNVPVLLQILSGAHTPQDLLPSGSVYTLERNKVVELTLLPLALAGPHPIHLHGHSFYVVKSAGTTQLNWDNAVRRDVVALGTTAGDNVVIRFETDNPGPWFLHCHIDFHLELGFAAVFAEDPEGTSAANPVPPAWDELCPLYENSHSRPLTQGTNDNNLQP